MKKFSFFHLTLALVVSFCSCGNKKQSEVLADDNVIVDGKLENFSLKTVYFEELFVSGVNLIDSVKTGEDGSFKAGLKIKAPGFFRFRVAPNNFFVFIASPGDSISVKADASKIDATYLIEGSDESARLKELNLFLQQIYRSNDSLNAALKNHQQNNDVNSYMNAVPYQQKLSVQFHDFIKDFIDKNPGTLSSFAAVQNLDAESNYEYYAKVETALKTSFPESPQYKDLKIKVDELRKLAVGSPAPEITLNDTEDKPRSLSSLKGKVVLIDFWASWCRPCRAENPNVVKMYNKYKDKGFEIFSVSLDKSKNAWLNAIKQDGLIWKNHVSDLGYWNSAVVPMYNIKGIPLTYLIDRDGIIIGKNLRGAQLEQKLDEIFKK